MLSCKGECKTTVKQSIGKTIFRYMNGQKRCGVCSVYLRWAGSKCPCCSAVLHVRPRHSRAKEKYYEITGIKWL